MLTSGNEPILKLGIGRLHERESNWNLAEKSSRQALNESGDPEIRQALNYRAGEVNSKLFNLDAAAKYFGESRVTATSIEDQVISAYAQARAYARADDFASAANTYSTFVELFPECWQISSPP